MPQKSSQGGFTLIEILLVALIISVIAGFLLMQFNPHNQMKKARNIERRSDITILHRAIYQYWLVNGVFPATITTTPTEICRSNATSCTGLIDLSILVTDAYIPIIPTDPTGATENSTGYTVHRTQASGGYVVVQALHAEGDDIYLPDDWDEGLSSSTGSTIQLGICGNGLVEYGENCDDGNTSNGDGCSSSCQNEAPAICDGECNIFVTNFRSDSGNLGGKSGADNICMNDENRPDGGIYKALLAVSGEGFSGRYADLAGEASSDWVLDANTTYYRSGDEIPIDTTNSNGWFTFDMDNSVAEGGYVAWTGLSSVTGLLDESGQNCQNWSTDQSDYAGICGTVYARNDTSVAGCNLNCNNFAHLYCVEQKQ